MQTLFGISSQIAESSPTIVWGVALPLITILIPVFVTSIFIAIIVTSAINVVGNIIVGCVTKKEGTTFGQIAVRNIILAIYSILWSHHLFLLNRNHQS